MSPASRAAEPPPITAPYGAWASPISAQSVARQAPTVQEIAVDPAPPDPADGESPSAVYWLETRPQDGGRGVIVRYAPGGVSPDRTPAPYSVRSRVHEYGGGTFAVHGGVIYFVNETDQRIYAQVPAHPPRPLTPPDGRRYADLIVDSHRGRLIAVCEDHRVDPQPQASLVAVDLGGDGEPQTLVAGDDFYAAPRLSPDGAQLAWLSWNHPDMPWDRTDLWRGALDAAGAVADRSHVAGGPDEAVVHPAWSPDGVLFFVSDATGWWNLSRETAQGPRPVRRSPNDFGHPHWVFGRPSYAFLSPRRLLCTFTDAGRWRLAALDVESGRLRPFHNPFGEIHHLHATARGVVFLAGAPDRATTVVALDGDGDFTDLRPPTRDDPALDSSQISRPEPITFPTTDDATAHAFYYPPHNPAFRAPPHERPPLIVRSHGGPTSATTDSLRLEVQFWTSRGFALVDVNYRGSSGYGRQYRTALNGHWGLLDVEDCIAAARFLIARHAADPGRLTIAGRSAGGFTTLAALTFHNVFAAGASYYGVSDLEALALDTHKFESRYLDRLIAPYTDRPGLYQQRSPLYHVQAITTPIIFFQGADDHVVPPDQTRGIVRALRDRGIPVASLEFPGERHGFQRDETQIAALNAELAFYGQILGFVPAGDIPPVLIDPPPPRPPRPAPPPLR